MKNINQRLSLIAIAVATTMTVGAVFAASTTNKGANPNGKPFVEIAGTIIEIEGEISSLQDQIDSLVGRVDTIEDAQTAMANAISSLQAENLTLQAQVDANATDIASLESQVFDLNTSITGLEQDIIDLGDADGVLQAQIDANEASITTLTLALDTLEGDLQATIDNNTALIDNMQFQIDQINLELVEKQNRVNGLCPDGSAIQEVLADGSVICELASGGGAGTLQSVSSIGALTGYGWGNSYASCPGGYVVTGGGHHGHNTSINDSRQLGNRWYVYGYSQWDLYAFATCTRIQP